MFSFLLFPQPPNPPLLYNMNIPVYYPATITRRSTAITNYVQRFYPGPKRGEGRVSIALVPIRMQPAIPLTSSTVNWNIIHLTFHPFRKNVRTRVPKIVRETKAEVK